MEGGTCGAPGVPCGSGSDCCSSKCTGPRGAKTCNWEWGKVHHPASKLCRRAEGRLVAKKVEGRDILKFMQPASHRYVAIMYLIIPFRVFILHLAQKASHQSGDASPDVHSQSWQRCETNVGGDVLEVLQQSMDRFKRREIA
eukprot:scaffold274631_cov45-Prasinocladus_malaysianus.AAC.1